MSQAKLGVGAVFSRGNGASPEVFFAIPEVRNIPDIATMADDVEVTNLDSTAREYIAGLQDGQQFVITMNYIPTDTQHAALLSDAATVGGVVRNFHLFYPIGTTSPTHGQQFAISATVKGAKLSGAPNEARTLEITCKMTGAYVVTNI